MNTTILRLPLLPVVALLVLAGGIGIVMASTVYDWQGFILVGAGLGIIAVFTIPRLARFEGGGNLVKVLTAALLAKFAFAMIRNWLAFGVYGGSADAARYNMTGTFIAESIHSLDFASVAPYLNWGTNSVELLTGIIYTITGPSIYAGYLVFAFLAFLGSYFFYRAFQVAFPYADGRLFLILIFFFPSLVYWPNGIGKDAIISLFIGLSAFGSARLVRNQEHGLLLLIVGLAGTAVIRPHIATVFAIALGLAVVVRGVGKRSVGPATYIFGLVVVVAIIWFIIPQLAAELGVEELSPLGVAERFMQQQSYSFEGGSAYQVVDITDPFRFPIEVLSLAVRPFPWETHNLQALAQAMEGVLLMVLVLWRIKNIVRAFRASITDIYLRYIIISIIGLLMGFSAIANFGLLVRERAMLLPFILMLLAYDRPPPVPEIGNKSKAPMSTVVRP
jgi:hypothetical protein